MSELVAVSVRMYQVGFGDCFLLSFEYDGPVAPGNRTERHMLIDFGRNTRPHHGGDMEQVARSIKNRCNNELDVLLVSHRHEDHLSAFGSKACLCAHRRLPAEAHRALLDRGPGCCSRPEQARVSVSRTANMSRLSRALAASWARSLTVSVLSQTRMGRRLKVLASTEYANEVAVDRLRDWGKAPGAKAEFLHVGKTSKMSTFIPGVDFTVLGPPLPTTYPKIAEQVSDHDKEFWHLWAQRVPLALEGAASLEAADSEAWRDSRARRVGAADADRRPRTRRATSGLCAG